MKTLGAVCCLIFCCVSAQAQATLDALSLGSGFNAVGFAPSVGWTFVPAVDMRVVAVGGPPIVPTGSSVEVNFVDSAKNIIVTYPLLITSETNLNIQAVNGLTLRKGSQYGISLTNPAGGNLVFTVYSLSGSDGISSFSVSPYINQFASFEVSGDGQWSPSHSDVLLLGPTFQFQVLPQLSISQTDTNILLSWSLQPVDYAVQQNPDFNLTNWLTLTNSPVVVGSQNQLTLPSPPGTMFYRLISQ